MMGERTCDGEAFKQALEAGTAWLERKVEDINLLNVFPVPDGDTGTNMFLTMQAALEEIARSPDRSLSTVTRNAAYGALMGARGNSGVILSQLLRGLAKVLDGEETLNVANFAAATKEASLAAYRGMVAPVEGTILTVAREAAEAAASAAEGDGDILYVLERVVVAAKHAVARTPSLLPVLREAGVVDAGGQGLFTILEGALHFARGGKVGEPSIIEVATKPEVRTGEEYGYEAMFILNGENLNIEEIKEAIAAMGDSVLVVGDSKKVKVHIHTPEPDRPLSYAAKLGTLTQISVENLQEQYQEFVRRKAETELQIKFPRKVDNIAVVAVVAGEGLAHVFESIGIDALVPGGQTMNPSTEEILKAIDALPVDEVILLPNNINVIMTAQQAQKLSAKKVAIVPTENIPQGVSALLAFNRGASLKVNVETMERAAKEIQTGEVTTAIRSTQIKGIRVKKGELIGLLNGSPVVSGRKVEEVVQKLLHQMEAERHEVISIYYGNLISQIQAEQLTHEICQRYPEQEVELVAGGQPHYHYILSVE